MRNISSKKLPLAFSLWLLPSYLMGMILIPWSVPLGQAIFGTAISFCLLAQKKFSRIFDPINFFILYINAQLVLGLFGFKYGLIYPQLNQQEFNSWTETWLLLGIVNLCSVILFWSNSIPDRLSITRLNPVRHQISNSQGRCFPAGYVLVCSPFLFWELDLSWVGAQGSLSVVPRTILACSLIFYVAKFRLHSRVFCYLFIVLSIALFSVHEKRDAIFLILPILWAEGYYNFARISMPSFITLAITLVLVLLLVASMSIARGYGGYPVDGTLFGSMPYVIEYLSSDHFISMFLNNIEASYATFHLLNSINIILADPSLMALGETFVKPLFSAFPRGIFPDKPNSILTLYTSQWDPVGRQNGVSWPITVYGEFFWNFHVAALLLLPSFVFAFTYAKRILLKGGGISHVFYLYLSVCTLTYMRGSGFDLYVIFLIIGCVFVLISECFQATFRKLSKVQ